MCLYKMCAKSGHDDIIVNRWLDEVIDATDFESLSDSGRNMETLDSKVADSPMQATPAQTINGSTKGSGGQPASADAPLGVTQTDDNSCGLFSDYLT